MNLSEQRELAELAGHQVQTAWLAPAQPRGAVVLAHGKVDDLDHPGLRAVAQGAGEAGWAAMRFNFPYRQEGRGEPDGFDLLCLVHQAACELALARLPKGGQGLVPGGKSQGSRTACALAGRLPAMGYLLMGYPLHQAREPERVAGAPLLALAAPLLMLQGERDPLCRPHALEPVLARLGAPHRLYLVPGGGHAFTVPGPPAAQDEVWRQFRGQARRFLAGLKGD